MNFISESEQKTIEFAKNFSKILKPGDIVCLTGELGAGKTTFVKGLARGLKVKNTVVNSPTFVLMNSYDGKWPVYHFDLYRIEGAELQHLGYEEFFYGQGISVIEWAERLGEKIPSEYFSVELKHDGENRRILTLKAKGHNYQQRLK